MYIVLNNSKFDFFLFLVDSSMNLNTCIGLSNSYCNQIHLIDEVEQFHHLKKSPYTMCS